MKFTVYSKDGCPYCTKVMQLLSALSASKGFPIREYVLGTDFNREEFYKQFGEGSTFPQVVMDQHHLGGCSDTVRYLQENKML